MSGPPEGAAARRFRREADRWDRIYEDEGHPLARWWDRLTRANVRRRFARTFERAGDLAGASVLDLGCGSGRYLVEAVTRGAARVVGVDFAPEMIAIARRLADATPGGERIELQVADVRDPGFAERFDLVIANGLFDYVDDARAVLDAAWRRTGRLLVATFPDRSAPRAGPRALYWRLRGLRIHLFDPGSIRALARDAGLGEVELEKIGPIWLMAARRA